MTTTIKNHAATYQYWTSKPSEDLIAQIKDVLDITEVPYYSSTIVLDFINSIIIEFYDERTNNISPVVKIDFRNWNEYYLVYINTGNFPITSQNFTTLYYAFESMNEAIKNNEWAEAARKDSYI